MIIKVRRIPEWKRAWKMASVRFGLVVVGFGLLPEAQQLAILARVGLAPDDAPLVIGLIFLLSRVFQFTEGEQ